MKPKSKQIHFKSKTHKELDNYKHIKITIENHNIKKVDKAFYEYIIEHNKKYKYYRVKCGFKLMFNDYEFCSFIRSKLFDK